MRHFSTISVSVLAGALLLSGCTSVRRPPPPTIDEVIAMHQGGASDDQILARVAESRGRYYLASDDVERLRAAGVSPRVVDSLLRTPWTPEVVYIHPSPYCGPWGPHWGWHYGCPWW